MNRSSTFVGLNTQTNRLYLKKTEVFDGVALGYHFINDIVAKSWISIVFSRPYRFWDNRIEKTSQSLCKWILVEFVIQSESSRKRGCFRILSISNIRIKLNITWTNCFWILFCIIILIALSQGTLIRHEW